MCNLKERKKKGRMEEVEEGRKGRKEGKKKRDTEKENEKKLGRVGPGMPFLCGLPTDLLASNLLLEAHRCNLFKLQ